MQWICCQAISCYQSINSSGQLHPDWNQHHALGGKKVNKNNAKDVENLDNWRTLQDCEAVRQEQNGFSDPSIPFGGTHRGYEEIAEEKETPFQEQVLHVSAVQPFIPNMSEIVECEWV